MTVKFTRQITNLTIKVAVFLLFSFSGINSALAQVDGVALFKNNCARCHYTTDEVLTGPGLAGVFDRVQEGTGLSGEAADEWIKSWIKNSTAMINSGDTYGNSLWDEYGPTEMPSFPTFKEEELVALLAYTKNPPAPPVNNIANGGGNEVVEKGLPKSILYVLLGILALFILFLSNVFGKLQKTQLAADGHDVTDHKNLLQKLTSKKALTLAGLALLIFGGYAVGDQAIKLGRSQGYTPEQPVYFSHKIHAGTLEIDCQYCHSGANKSKHALIPSNNVCMNCHKGVAKYTGDPGDGVAKEGFYNGKNVNKEIAKVKAAFASNEPIEWVRIHNLPDHVYFNHAQHVNAGGLECQTCHGEVQEMDVLGQHAPLSMGWCINCHRQTEVQFANNDYYKIYEKYHDELANGTRDGVTVEDIGGLECAKCHY